MKKTKRWYYVIVQITSSWKRVVSSAFENGIFLLPTDDYSNWSEQSDDYHQYISPESNSIPTNNSLSD